MRLQELQEALRRQPFQPFRIHLTNGQTFDVGHPEFAALTRTSIFVGHSSGDDEIPDRMIQCDLLHVVTLEPINGQPKPA
jgi:hypothetical protein